MDKFGVYNRLVETIAEDSVYVDELMSKHTSFKIGGLADILVLPATVADIQTTLEVCNEKNSECFIMGNGSNLLVRDKGIRGVVVKIADNFSKVVVENDRVTAQAGVLLSTLSKLVANKGLAGFEFASGIPGTLGGAVAMNAGAYGGEMRDVITGALVIDRSGKIMKLGIEELELGYRSSIIQKNDYIVLEASIKLREGNINEIKKIIKDLTERRTTKQPLQLPSAGSTFKRPPGYFAGKLIEDACLKGVRVGDAQVSVLHSGFIVNVGNATAEDVIDLIGLVQKVVRDKYEVELHPEVRIIGEV